MLPFSCIISNQIRFLLKSVNDSNFDSTYRELIQFVEYGNETSSLLLQFCLDHVNYQGWDIQNYQLKQDLLSATFRYILDRPNFCTIFCEALGATTMSEGFLVDLSNILNLSAAEKTGIGLALSESETQDFRMKGQNFSIAQIEDLCANPNPEISNKQIQEVLLFIYRSEGLSKHVDSFTKILSLMLFKANAFFGETPMLSDDIRDVASLRQMDLFSEFFDNDFESVLEEIEKEISMADIVRELGYRCTANVSRIEMLSLFLPLSEMTLFKLLSVMARSHFLLNDTQNMHSAFCSALNYKSSCGSPLLSSWNVDVLVDAIMQLAPTTNWISVMENLDHEGFSIPDEQSFTLLMSIYARASQDAFPLHVFCGSVWKNEEGQLSFLRHAISAQPDIFTLMHCSRQLAHADSANLSKGNENQAWSCPDLLNVLCQLSEKGYVNSARLMLEQPLNQCPEVLLVGIAHINTPYNLLQYGVFSTVFPMLLRDPTKSGTIHHLWRVNPEMVLRGFIDTHTDSNNLFRILDICQELKILSSVLDVTPFPVSIRSAAVAFRMEHLMLEEWLLKNLKIYEVAFFENCFNFIKEIISELDKDVPDISLRQCTETIRNVYQETYLVFLKVLEAHYGNLSSLQSSEKLKSFTIFSNSKSRSSMSANMSASSVSSYDIKAEANAFIHHMFSGKLTIDDSVHRLACFKESSGTRERLIFDCIVANIIEEYKIFPTYPDRQLTLAAVLFGSLIKHRLLTDFQLSIALHGVLDSLHKSVDSKMFLFGTKALEQFTERLVEWPYYCNQILQISHLHGEHAGLVSVVEHALAQWCSSHADSTAEKSLPSEQQLGCSSPTLESMEASSSLSFQAFTPQSTNAHVAVSLSSPFLGSCCNAKSAGFGFALNIETLVTAAEGRAHRENPASDVQDKILFMINNISSANIDSKAVEFTTILTEQYYPWFAEYLVMKRVSIEPNLQHMYLKFLEKVNSRSLNNEIVKATYENCKVLLRSELIKSSSEERSLLKNLGSWLGKFTIGRNRALLAKEIDPKVLIIEAYEKGLMIAVIPFTSKILETCQSSMAYRPPNPWTMGILGLLSEIYHLPNLKMNLKFDIEVLFKNLTLDMKSVIPTSLLKERAREVEGNPDFSNKDIGISRALVKTPTISHINPQSKYAASALISSITMVEDEKTRDLIVPEHVHSAKGLTQFTLSPASSQTLNQILNCIIDGDSHINRNSAGESLLQLDRIFQGAVNSAIREVEPHVTRCSVAVASQTTKELVLKDYAMEIDVSKSTRAARLMVDNLAGNLAYALCKEHLRLALSNYIQNLLQTLNFDGERMEQTVQSLTTKYLPLGCEGIRTIASEKAIELINEQIVLAFASVKRRQEATSSFHNDVGTYSHRTLVCIPEVLHPRPGRMTIAQEQVYDGFIGNIWQSTCGNSSSILPACPAGLDGITVTRPLDLIDEEIDGSAQHSCRTSNLGPTDDVIHSVSGSESFAPFHANVKSNELNDASRLANICTVLDVGALSSPALSPGMEDALSETSISSGEEVIFLFNEWYHICELPATNATAYTRFISQLHEGGFLKGDDITYWFFHFLLVQSSDSLSIQTSNYRGLQLEPIDAFAKLVVLVLKHTSSVPGSTEVFLAKVLSMTTSLILEDAEKKKAFFNPRLYSRLFVNWFLGLISSDPLPDAANFQVLTSFANAFHTLQPVKVPSFSFAWLELVSHKNFMPKLLAINHSNSWLTFQQLLVDLFKFLGPYLRNAELKEPIQVLYKGTLRMLLILLYDFPEFLCSFHSNFCDTIPHSCIQMRNIILSASPRNIKIPNPRSPNLKIDLLPEMSLAPCILSDIDGALSAKHMKAAIDEYIKTRPEQSTFLAGLQQKLLLSESEASILGASYDVPLINSLVLYVGMQAIQQLPRKHTVQTTSTQEIYSPMDIFQNEPAIDIFQSLIQNLDEEGRYYFLSSVADQLRFPNSHTHYFSHLLLYLFMTGQEIIKEQITRVLVERCIVYPPKPWGLLTTFIELTKNPNYNFWNCSYTRRTEDTKNLLENVCVAFC